MKRILLFLSLCAIPCTAQELPRVFISDSQSWFAAGGFAVSDGSGGGAYMSGQLTQTVELMKQFSTTCPGVVVSNDKNNAAYVVLLDRDAVKRATGGIYSLLSKVDRIAVFKRNGDLLYAGSARSVANAVKDSCAAIARMK